MPTPYLDEVYPVKLVYAGPTTLYLNQLDSVEVNPGIEVLEAAAAGSVDPQLLATAFAEPKVSVTSRDVATIMAAISPSAGLVLTSGIIQWERRAGGGTWQGTLSHYTASLTGGFAYAKEITCKQDDKEGASVTLDVCPVWDGTNLPLVMNASQTLVGTPAANAVHALGPVIFEGAQLGGVQSITVKTGIEVRFKRQDGELYSRIVCIVKRRPMIEIELVNTGLAATLTLGTTYAISTGTVCYLQKVVPGGGRVAVGTATHMSFTAAAGIYKVDSISGSKGDDAALKLTIQPTTLSGSAATAITIP